MNLPLNQTTRLPIGGPEEGIVGAWDQFSISHQFPRTIHTFRRLSEVAERGLPGSEASPHTPSLRDEFFKRDKFQEQTQG